MAVDHKAHNLMESIEAVVGKRVLGRARSRARSSFFIFGPTRAIGRLAIGGLELPLSTAQDRRPGTPSPFALSAVPFPPEAV